MFSTAFVHIQIYYIFHDSLTYLKSQGLIFLFVSSTESLSFFFFTLLLEIPVPYSSIDLMADFC
jgi:hypothetical protein